MINEIMNEMQLLNDERTYNKHIADGCDIPVIGVKIGDMKKLVKKYNLKKNNQIAIQLIETKIYDFMYLGYLILDVKTVERELLEKWIDYSNYYKIRIHSLAYGIAEHPDFELLLDTLKDESNDYHLSMYYGALAAKIIIQPDYNNQFIVETARKIAREINTEKYQKMDNSKLEMNSFIGYVGMQLVDYSQLMIELSHSYFSNLIINNTVRKPTDQSRFIQNCINSNGCGKVRKSARC